MSRDSFKVQLRSGKEQRGAPLDKFPDIHGVKNQRGWGVGFFFFEDLLPGKVNNLESGEKIGRYRMLYPHRWKKLFLLPHKQIGIMSLNTITSRTNYCCYQTTF